MKKAFTMIELVFVLVVVGIITAMIAPNFRGDNLREAADQVMSHIRYTQHLAMVDDKYDTNDPKWFLGRWQIYFVNNSGSDNEWAYTIFSDWMGTHTGNPDLGEAATNPLNKNQFLTGGTSGTNIIHYGDPRAMKELNIGHKYGVSSVAFSGGCRSNVRYISFDYMGRPSNSFPQNLPYELPAIGYHKLLTTPCIITLSNGIKDISISIEPETGYVHIL